MMLIIREDCRKFACSFVLRLWVEESKRRITSFFQTSRSPALPASCNILLTGAALNEHVLIVVWNVGDFNLDRQEVRSENV